MGSRLPFLLLVTFAIPLAAPLPPAYALPLTLAAILAFATAFAFVVVHGYRLGTDMKNILVGNIFLGASFFLALIYVSSLGFALLGKLKKKQVDTEISQ